MSDYSRAVGMKEALNLTTKASDLLDYAVWSGAADGDTNVEDSIVSAQHHLAEARSDLKFVWEAVEEESDGRRPRCGACGMPYHRYGWGDREHDYDPTACINSLRGEIDRLQLWHDALRGEDDE
jgi:hypothetical protein